MSNPKNPIFLIFVTWIAIAAVYFNVKSSGNTDEQAADSMLQQEFNSLSDKMISLDRRVQTLEANAATQTIESNPEQPINEEVQTEEKPVETNSAETSTDGSVEENTGINPEEVQTETKPVETNSEE